MIIVPSDKHMGSHVFLRPKRGPCNAFGNIGSSEAEAFEKTSPVYRVDGGLNFLCRSRIVLGPAIVNVDK